MAMLVYQRVPQTLLSQIACLDFMGLLFSHPGSDIPKIGPSKNRSIKNTLHHGKRTIFNGKIEKPPELMYLVFKNGDFFQCHVLFFGGEG